MKDADGSTYGFTSREVMNFMIYYNGYCYYEVPIRHFTDQEVPLDEDHVNGQDQLGRYGIVRNHYYQLSINSINKPGKPISEDEVIPDTDPDDFEIRSTQELSEMLNTTTDLMTTLLACIAGISLVVGGIGIMNIMYVSVTERTKEIGLRMSVGARGMDILNQFLIESVLISITGGLIGVIVGCGASFAVKWIAHWPVYIQTWSVILSFAVCTLTGVFFGWYPAKKASGLDPIDALRYE